jgi:hypothetical protein
MADTVKERVIVVDPKTAIRESTVEEMRQLRKNPLDRAKKKGGYFLRLDGTARDANGKRIAIEPEDLEHIKARRELKGMPPLGKKPKARDEEPDLTAGTDDAEQPEGTEEPQPEPMAEDAPVEAPRAARRRSSRKKK